MNTETLQQRVDRFNTEMGFQPYSSNKAQFGQPVRTKAHEKRLSKREKEEKRKDVYEVANEVLYAAKQTDDDRLIYCIKCSRCIGFIGEVFSHECTIPCHKHDGCFRWYTDVRKYQAEKIAACGRPGTIWAEVSA